MTINFCITPADIQDRDMIAPLLKLARRRFPSLARAIADGGYQGPATATAVREEAGIPLEIVKRSDHTKGFKVLPQRWMRNDADAPVGRAAARFRTCNRA